MSSTLFPSRTLDYSRCRLLDEELVCVELTLSKRLSPLRVAPQEVPHEGPEVDRNEKRFEMKLSRERLLVKRASIVSLFQGATAKITEPQLEPKDLIVVPLYRVFIVDMLVDRPRLT